MLKNRIKVVVTSLMACVKGKFGGNKKNVTWSLSQVNLNASFGAHLNIMEGFGSICSFVFNWEVKVESSIISTNHRDSCKGK